MFAKVQNSSMEIVPLSSKQKPTSSLISTHVFRCHYELTQHARLNCASEKYFQIFENAAEINPHDF